MSSSVNLPFWLFALLLVFAVLGLWLGSVAPLARRIFYRRRERALRMLDEQLAFGIANYGLAGRAQWRDRLFTDPEVSSRIDSIARESSEALESVRMRAHAYIAEIVPFFNALLYFRLGYWVARWLLRAMYWIRAEYADQDALGRIARDSCVVLVSNHRSNIDPFLMIYLASRRSAVSYSAGEWALAWPFHQLLHAIGFYIVRRDGNSDPLYRTLLERYVFLATSHCVPQGLFLEGGLSRDGEMLPLKLGLLSYLLRAQGHGKCRDIVFVPVGLSYDRIPEDRALLEHRESGFRNRGKLYSLLSFTRFMVLMMPKMLGLSKPFGQVVANFGQPLSLQQWLSDRATTESRERASIPREAVMELGAELRDRIIRLIPVLPIALLSEALLQGGESGLSELQLKQQALAMGERLKRAGVCVALTADSEDHAFNQALVQLLKRRMVVVDRHGRMCASAAASAMLSYYRNAIPLSLRAGPLPDVT